MRQIYFIYLFHFCVLFLGCQKSEENPNSNIGEMENNTIKDIDGNVYKTVTIGSQIWMAENLRVTHFNNGEEIPNIQSKIFWNGTTSGACCDYDNSAQNSIRYGKLYNWFAVNDKRGIAPKGWRVANKTDWQTLIIFLGGQNVAGGKLKESGIINWKSPNIGATNSTGFTALPSGGRDGDYFGIGEECDWWDSTPTNTTSANRFYIESNTESIGFTIAEKNLGLSVRCIKDN